MYVFLAAIFSSNITSGTNTTDGNRKKLPKGTRMKTPSTLELRVKVGSFKLVLAMAGVRRQPFAEG